MYQDRARGILGGRVGVCEGNVMGEVDKEVERVKKVTFLTLRAVQRALRESRAEGLLGPSGAH